IALVIDPQIICTMAFIQVNNNGSKSIEFDSFIPVGPKDQRLTIFQKKGFVGLASFLSKNFKGPIVEDVTILIDLQERSTVVRMCSCQHGLQMLGISVHAPCYKCGIGT